MGVYYNPGPISTDGSVFYFDPANKKSYSGIGTEISPGGSWTTLGNISSVRVYNRALTASEVLQNFNATKSRFGL